jgi:hypothetical protein
VDRSEITDIFCAAISTGSVPALLNDHVSERTKGTLVSGTRQTNSGRDFLGTSGLSRLAEFCRQELKIAAGEMTGCVMKGECLFAFGKVRFGTSAEQFSAETSFVVNIVWDALEIISAELRIMWPIPPKEDTGV